MSRLIFCKTPSEDWCTFFDTDGHKEVAAGDVFDKLDTIYTSVIADKEIIFDKLISFDIYPGGTGMCNYRQGSQHLQVTFTHALNITAGEETALLAL